MSGCTAGNPDPDDVQLFHIFQASEILRCKPWELAEQSEFWMDKAFWFVDVMGEVQAGLRRVAAIRAGETPDEDDD